MSNGTRWLGAKVSEDDFDAVHELCAILGHQLRFVLPEVIQLGIEAKAELLKNPSPEIELWKIVKGIEKREHVRDMLERLGLDAKVTQSTAAIDTFETQCDIFGYDAVEMLKQIDVTHGPSPIDIKPSGTSVETCKRWLKQKMVPGEEYLQSKIMEDGKACGFKEHVINKAKRQLHIKSSKKTNVWRWTYPVSDTTPYIVAPITIPDDEPDDENAKVEVKAELTT